MTFLELSNWHFTIETLAYSEGFAFSEEEKKVKKDPLPAKSRFENSMGSQKLIFLIVDRNAQGKMFRIKIWALSFQLCFQNQFLTLGSGQTDKVRAPL